MHLSPERVSIPSSEKNSPAEQKHFTVNGFDYAAQLWSQESGDGSDQLPAIALHGWLDNSASFSVLAPQLKNIQCLAIDLAGHGCSEHKTGLADYPLWSDISAIYAIADQMGWQRFTLIGHSRGAMMALLAAGVFPERISHLIMIDSMMPPVVESHQAVERFCHSIEEIQRRVKRPLSLYSSYDEAIKARCDSRYAPVTSATARRLADRGLREVEGQFHWHADGKLWAPSNVALSYDMVMAFAQKIAKTPLASLLLMGDHGLVKMAESNNVMRRQCDQLIELLSTQVHNFDDGHFLHMEKAASEVANIINAFLSVKAPLIET
ncbi:MAG: pimeloyl-ACP methyl ester carboxylesterase [Candidatus Endobugula sp.]|jgi:pimeloyl-ACP methyl ester carboxylesterase